ncbi:NAD(P)H-dependent oxidoreductase [Rhizobium sp. LC145]|uniref:NADPH-dependent FMN reductase n=1 Tax=Rhizobium sp. LC145 TaxID=1120688 RepID=UPI000629E187|nr:NAD(P)H-dependent oxidoreductase [Rhizobium sp. LC145]KKX29542.1 FMN reductase [Rhizobium sp. LC145]TKT66067.1 NAD(P)H-dependent oxidoreductase [Rhizobiaceae bacterium LC148]
MKTKITVALIYGSARPGRFCDVVADWVLTHLPEMMAADIVIVDPADLAAETRNAKADMQARIARDLARADAFLVVTPEYNHGYTAALKELIDMFYEPWWGKPVGFVSYGGVSGGLRAVEQLRQVFAELGTVAIRESVSFAHAHEKFDDAGNLYEPQRAARQLEKLARQLTWWASTLKAGREALVVEEAV